MAYLPLRKAVAELGLTANTLRKYADDGLIPVLRNAGGQRLFDVDTYLRRSAGASVVLYGRVSSTQQRDDLARQIERLRQAYPEAEVIQDIGSGLNFKRKGLRSLLERLLRGDKLRVVVSHRDRLARFGIDAFQFLIEYHGGELVVLDPTVEASREAELTADLLAILQHFSCRMHGQRSHQGKKGQDLPNAGAEDPVSAVARNLALRLQRDRQTSESSQGRARGALDGSGEDHSSEPARVGGGNPVPDQENRH